MIKTVTVKRCQRCGEDHPGLTFTQLDHARDMWNMWAVCPSTMQPLLLANIDDVPKSDEPNFEVHTDRDSIFRVFQQWYNDPESDSPQGATDWFIENLKTINPSNL